MNRAERRAANKANKKRLPIRMRPVAREQWPRDSDPSRVAVFVSQEFMAQVFAECPGSRVSVNRVQVGSSGWKAEISWDELQRVKREIGMGDAWAVEIYPPDSQVVNVANMRHLWVYGLDGSPGFGWTKKGVAQ